MIRVTSSFEGPGSKTKCSVGGLSRHGTLSRVGVSHQRPGATTTVPLAIYVISLLKVEAEIELFVEDKFLACICKIDFAFTQPGRPTRNDSIVARERLRGGRLKQ